MYPNTNQLKNEITLPHMDGELTTLVETAIEAATAAGKLQMQFFRAKSGTVCESPRDIKSVIDVECEDIIAGIIRKRFRDHRIIAEEGGEIGGSGEHLWIVDPLDGTVNYFHGVPHFCSCLACLFLPGGRAQPTDSDGLLDAGLLGIVHVPSNGDTYVGIRGHGAFFNGNQMNCPDYSELAASMVAVSLGKSNASIMSMLEVIGNLAPRVRKVRSYGCAGLDISMVSAGCLGGVIYRGIHIWDLAAAGIILQEAGGTLKARQMQNGAWNMVASHNGIAKELLQIAPLS
jgi:fructose-1,6-bisphosphatase/inositol monophosphatase family enzyme